MSASDTKTRHTFSLLVEELEFTCRTDPTAKARRSIVVLKTSEGCVDFTEFPELVAACPWLITRAKLVELATLANFLVEGLKYKVIDDPETKWDYSWSAYGEFDVEEITEPRLEVRRGQNYTLIFYATMQDVPQRVHFKFAPGSQEWSATYEQFTPLW